MDFTKVKNELELMDTYPLSSHGLSQSEPLKFEMIIRGCFANPDRKLFPEFMKNRGWNWKNCPKLYNEYEDPEHWIRKLNPELVQKFDDSRIILSDTSNFRQQFTDSKEPYL